MQIHVFVSNNTEVETVTVTYFRSEVNVLLKSRENFAKYLPRQARKCRVCLIYGMVLYIHFYSPQMVAHKRQKDT